MQAGVAEIYIEQGAVWEYLFQIFSDTADLSVKTDPWSASTSYVVNDAVYYNNGLWKCMSAHSNQTPTEGSYWTAVAPMDLTGLAARGDICDASGTKLVSPTWTITDAANGWVKGRLTAVQSAAIAITGVGYYDYTEIFWDCELYDPDDTTIVYRGANGTGKISPEVTR